MSLRRLSILRWLVAAGVTAGLGVLVAGAPASGSAPAARAAPGLGPAARVTLELVPVTRAECAAPRVLIGGACVDKSGTFIPDKWTFGDRSAQWAPGPPQAAGQWRTTYAWTVPQTIPPAGAALTLKLTAAELTKLPNARVCPAMSARGGVDFRAGSALLPQPVGLGVCAQSGGTASDSKTVRVVPTTAGPETAIFLLIGLQDGAGYTYKYRAAKNKGAAATPTVAKRECDKTYVIQPSGVKITAKVKLVDLDEKQIAGVRQKEALKYEGFDYAAIGPATRRQNCAGYVMRKLFGSRMVQANIEPDYFFRKIVVPYGEKRFSRLTARAGDVVVYRDAAGVVKHVAIVESNVARLKILTKDGDERLYRATFPLGPLRLTNDPLVKAHTGNGTGTVEFWQLDRSRVSIQAVSAGRCDED